MGGETGLCCVCVPGPVTVRYQSHGYGLGGKGCSHSLPRGRTGPATSHCSNWHPLISHCCHPPPRLPLHASTAVSLFLLRSPGVTWTSLSLLILVLRLLVLQSQPLLQLMLPQLLLLLHPHPLWRMDW